MVSGLVVIVGLVGLLLAFLFRKKVAAAAEFVSTAAHAFATEYNSAYTDEDNEEEMEKNDTVNFQTKKKA